MHCVEPGAAAIDRALAPVLDLASRMHVRLIVVLRPAKLMIAEHLRPVADRVDLVFTYQADRHGLETAGALAAAAPLCTSRVLLVLPDQFYRRPGRGNPLATAVDRLAHHRWAVVAARLTDPAALRAEGALRLDDDARVTDAAEKPADPAPFNAAWVSLACRRDALDEMPKVFDRAAASPLTGAPAVLVDGYRNLTVPGAA
ncbi:hypothetical protein ACLQ26_27765 [Micromonospora sp. DT43]|uniref:hypothetical protein n=1 Tax=Micromonospora sp. DT43 TaxID=3393440 RepID=UPI003CE9A739